MPYKMLIHGNFNISRAEKNGAMSYAQRSRDACAESEAAYRDIKQTFRSGASYAAAAVAKKAVAITPMAMPIAMAIPRDLRMAVLLPKSYK
jgi:hypothetical protein